MNKSIVFCATKNGEWYLYQFERVNNRPKKVVVAEGIRNMETARFMSETLTEKFIGKAALINIKGKCTK